MRRRRPVALQPGGPLVFPDPRLYDEEGLVAVGGDLGPARLLLAYESGIFPWFGDDLPPLWWSPDPRAVILPARLHCSRRLHRRLRRGEFTFTWNVAFTRVMEECGAERSDGTWVTPDMLGAYTELHRLGHAHSLEVWQGTAARPALVGGIYGVHRGGLFAAESMFHRVTDASKAALVVLVRALAACGVEVVDVQFLTPHLESMGAEEWSRARYLAQLGRLRELPVDLEAMPGRLCAITAPESEEP